jgi:hypothetical protein
MRREEEICRTQHAGLLESGVIEKDRPEDRPLGLRAVRKRLLRHYFPSEDFSHSSTAERR